MPPDPSPRRRLVLVVLLVGALVALAGCSEARPPSVCATCDDRMTDRANASGANVSVVHSELHLYLRDDGSARWVARVALDGPGVDDLRTDGDLRRQVVEQRLANDTGPGPEDHANLTTAMDGDTLVVGFDDPSLADRHVGGVLVVDRFNAQESDDGGRRAYALRADLMVLHLPDGWEVLNRPPGAGTGTDAVRWDGEVAHRTYVAVGPADAPAGHLRGQAAVAAEVTTWAAPPVVWGSLVPMLLLGAALSLSVRRFGDVPDREPADGVDHELAGALTATGAALVCAFLAVGVWHREVGGIVDAVVSPFTGPAGGGGLALVVFVGLTLVPPALAFAVAGVVTDRRAAVRWPAAAVALATAPLEATQLVLSDPFLGSTLRFLMVPWAILAVGVAVGAFVAGRRTARSQGWAREDGTEQEETPQQRQV